MQFPMTRRATCIRPDPSGTFQLFRLGIELQHKQLPSIRFGIEGSKPLCLRVLMHVNTELEAPAVQHVYLHDAVDLRDDL